MTSCCSLSPVLAQCHLHFLTLLKGGPENRHHHHQSHFQRYPPLSLSVYQLPASVLMDSKAGMKWERELVQFYQSDWAIWCLHVRLTGERAGCTSRVWNIEGTLIKILAYMGKFRPCFLDSQTSDIKPFDPHWKFLATPGIALLIISKTKA